MPQFPKRAALAAALLLVAAVPLAAQDAAPTPDTAPTGEAAPAEDIAPADAPADIPADVPAGVPTDAPSDVPTDAPTDVPSDAPTAAPAIAADDPVVRDAEMMPRAARSLLLDAVRTPTGYVAVGERGHILVSGDGKTWTQAQVPTRTTLTTVTAADDQLWAGGHDGVIVQSSDGGKTWTRRRVAPWSLDVVDPSEGVPVMDMLFTDAQHGFAIGAYSLMLVTDDGGQTWTPRSVLGEAPPPAPVDENADTPVDQTDDWTFDEADLMLEAESDPHLNAMARTGSGALVIAGERGTFLRSRDGGETWENRRLPYEGSMFGVLAWEDDHILVFGLRGNVYESTDLGEHWDRVDTGVGSSLMGGTALPDGGAVLVGANGVVLVRATAAEPFVVKPLTQVAGQTLAGVVAAGDTSYLIVGDKGADVYNPQ